MRIWLFAPLVALSATSILTSLAAQPREEQGPIGSKNLIEPDKGYIYLETPYRFGGTFIRVPDFEDIANYNKALDEAVAKEKERQAKKTAKREQQAKGGASKTDKPSSFEPKAVAIGMIETRTSVQFGPGAAYFEDKSAGRYGYLSKVKPGTYIWYGPVVYDQNLGMVGQCYCMGSVRFDVKPGMITNLGTSLGALPDYAGQRVAPPLAIELSGGMVKSPKIQLFDGTQKLSYELPKSLMQFASEQAQLRASGKMNNFYGLMISRLPSIEGVLGYDRDTVIDLRTGERLVAETLPD